MLRAKVSRTQPPTAHFDGRTPSRTPATPAKPSAPVCDLAESPRAFAPVKGVLKLSLRFNTGATHELAVKADTKVSQIKLDIQRRTAIAKLKASKRMGTARGEKPDSAGGVPKLALS